MNKKIVLFLTIIITIFFCTIAFYRVSFRFEELIISDNEWNSITNSKKLSNELKINSLKFDNYEIFYDVGENTYYYSLIEDSNTSYNPSVTFSSNEKVTLALNNKISNELISSNGTIELLIYNDKKYNIYNLKCTTLPILNINYDESIEEITRDNVDMSMYLFDNRSNATKRVTTSDGKIHVRGGTTAFLKKKGYKVSLTTKSIGNNIRNNDISLLGMRKDDDWILYAGYNDQEKIRNVFSSKVWYESCANNNMFGVTNGNEYKYVELFFNNKYWGLYAIAFPIDEKQLNVDEQNEYLFKKVKYTESEKLVVDEKLNILDGYELKSKHNNDDIAWQELIKYYYTLQTSKSIEELYNIVDINSLIDTYLFQIMIQADDNPSGMRLKNIYMTIKDYDHRKVMLYTPWDFDVSFGNGWNAEAKNHIMEYQKTPDIMIEEFKFNSINFLHNLGDLEIDSLIKNRYKQLRAEYWTEENFGKILSEYENDIYNSGAFSRDKTRWVKGTYNDEKDKLSNFKKHVFERLKYVDTYIGID